MEFFEIGARIAEERQRLGYTQAAFARLLDMSLPGLRKVEGGLSEFKVNLLVAAASAGVDVQYVVTGVRSPNTNKVADEIGFEKQVIQGNVSGIGFVGDGATVHINHNPKTIVKAETKPGVDHIDEGQCAVLKDLVDQVVEKEAILKKAPKTHRAVWASLNKHCGVATYRLIARTDFDKAKSYLLQWMGSLNGMKSAPIKDGVAWRNSRLKALHANVRGDQLLEQAMRAYIKREFKAESLADLANDELEKTYRYVAGKRSRNK